MKTRILSLFALFLLLGGVAWAVDPWSGCDFLTAGTGVTITCPNTTTGGATISASGSLGPGTANTIAKFATTTTIGNSTITDDGSTVAITISKTWTWDGDVQTIGNACGGGNTVCGLVVDAFNGVIYGGDGVSTTGGGVGTVVFGSGSAVTGSAVAAFAAGIAATVSGDHAVGFSATVSGDDSFGFNGTVTGHDSVLFSLGASATLAGNNTFQVSVSATPELIITSGNVAASVLTVSTRTGTPAKAAVFTSGGILAEQTGKSQAYAVTTSTGTCTLTFTAGILTANSGSCP